MRRFWIFCSGALLIFLLVFLIAEAAHLPLLHDPLPYMRSNPALSGVLGFSLLAADALIPVPSSIVMMTHGALFGLCIGGLISLVGSVTSALIGFAIGKASRSSYAALLGDVERERARFLLERWGPLAVAASRPVPLLAETVAVTAGAGGMRTGTLLVASVVGNLPPALLYAWAGSRGTEGAGIWPFLMVLVVSATFFLMGRWFRRADSA